MDLSCRSATRTGQNLSGNLIPVRKEFVNTLMENFKFAETYEKVAQSMFVNIVETAIFIETKPKNNVNKNGDKTIYIHCTGSNRE